MSTLTPETQVHWTDPDGAQQGPVPADQVVSRIQAGELPASTMLWWPEAPGWTPADQVPGLADHLAAAASASTAAEAPAPAGPDPAAPATGAPAPGGPDPAAAPSAGPSGDAGAQPGPEPDGGHATDALMAGLSDQELDDEFIALVDRSWEMFKETEKASTIDEAIVAGIVTALVDSGFVLIDITTGVQHALRFEVPTTGARVTIDLQHLTADLASAKTIGHRAELVVGYGERLGNAGQIGQALRGEVASSFVATPEPGTVSFDADISSGYVYARIELYLEPERYIDDSLAVDHDLLRRHIAALVHTMRTFVHTRFAS